MARSWVIAAILFGPTGLSAQTVEAFASAPQLVLHEVVELGGMDPRPEYAFSTIRDLALLPSGRLAVADGASQEIRLFDLNGELFGVIGGKGDGPGEFRAIRDVVVLPNGHLLVWDIQRRRVTIFDPDGEVAETYLVDAGAADIFFPRFAGAFADGGVLIRDQVHPMGMKEERASARRDPITLVVYRSSGAVGALKWTFEGPERDFYNEDGMWGFDDPLFAKDLTHTVIGDTVFVAHTDSAVIRRFVGATELPAWRIWGTGPTATQAEVEAERAARLAVLDERLERRGPAGEFDGVLADMRAQERERVEQIRWHETLPAFARLHSSDDGQLWIQGFPDRGAGIIGWYRLSSDGVVSGRLALPIDEELMALTDTWLGTVRKDDFGVETVVLYRIADP